MKEPKRIIRIQLVTREQKSQPNSARPLQELLNKFLEKMNLTAEYCPRVYSVRGLNFKLHTKMDKSDNQPDMVLVNLDTLVNDGDISIKAIKQDYPKMLFTGLSSAKTKQSVMNMGYDGYLPTLFNQMNLKELFKDKSKIDLDKLPVVDELEKDDHCPNRTSSTSTVHSDNRSDHRHWNNNGKRSKFNRNNHKNDHKLEESVQSKFADVKSEQIESKKESADSNSVKTSLDTTHTLENKPESSVTDTANTDKQAEENSNTEVNKDYSEGSGNKTSDKPTDKDQTDAKSEESEQKIGFAVKVEANGEQKLDKDDHVKDESDDKSEDTDAKSDDSDNNSDKSTTDTKQKSELKPEKKDDDASLEDDFENINFDDVSGDGIELNIPVHQSEERDAGKNNSDNESGKSDEKDKRETDDHQVKPFNVLADLRKDKDNTDSKSENADHDGKFTDKKSEKDSALEGLSKIMNGRKPKNNDPVINTSNGDEPKAPDQGAGDTDTKNKKKDWTLDRPIHDGNSGILGDDNDDGDLDQLQKILNHEVVMDDSSDADDQNQEND